MPKTFKITEAQHQQMIEEGVVIQGATDSTGKADINKTSQQISSTGIDPKKTKVEFDGSAMSGGGGDTTTTTTTTVSEHRVVTKKELQENRLRYLRENSQVMSFDKFMKNLH